MTATRRLKSAVKASAAGLWQWLRGLNAKDIIEGLAKLAAPLAVVVGGILAHNFESSLTMTQLLASREDADTKIRAEMFRAITEKLLGANAKEPEPDRKAVFSELLALNFHEHFELKPLLRDVDEALRTQIDAEADPKRQAPLENRRLELVSVVRRVRERQMAMLVRPNIVHGVGDTVWWERWWAPDPEKLRYQRGDVRMFSVRFDGKAPTGQPVDGDSSDASPCDLAKEEVGQSACATWPMFENAPDGRGAIAISVLNADWKSDTFTLLIKPVPRHKELTQDEQAALDKLSSGTVSACERVDKTRGVIRGTSAGAVEFDITWFDMPLTDNTQMWSGSRFSVFINQVCGKDGKGAKVVKFGLMWFPEDYFPPRERPTNYHEFRQRLNLTARPQE